MIDEGYIKFEAIHEPTLPFNDSVIDRLIQARQTLYDAGLIGMYPNGIGFGNISLRIKDSNQFYITGSATGGITQLTHQHIAIVNQFDIRHNKLWCSGPIVASSESMSHGVIYQQCPEVMAVAHIHNLELWQQLLFKIPTTPENCPYGTPEMAQEIIRLLNTTNLKQEQIFAMAGHQEGIFGFGKDLNEACQVILAHYTMR